MDYTKVFVYVDNTCSEEPLEWMSDDYAVRYTQNCEQCGYLLEPHYDEPFASCECGTREWYK